MYLKLGILFFSIAFAMGFEDSRRDIFDQNADSLVQDIIGDIDMERFKWTTPSLDELEEHFKKITESTQAAIKTTQRRRPKKRRNMLPGNFSFEDIRMRIKLRNVMSILDDSSKPNLNFNEGIDDTAVLTRRFDAMKENFLRERTRIRKHNIWRNQTIKVMDHFIHAIRYKLPYTQLLRKKYYEVLRYRMGYCFGLLTHLKRQQMYVYTALQFFHNKVFYIHFHMRMYEKVVRLDVDIKDVIRFIRRMEARRRILADPKYYEEYYDEESTTTTKAPGVEVVQVEEVTRPKAKVFNDYLDGHNIATLDPVAMSDAEKQFTPDRNQRLRRGKKVLWQHRG